MADYVTIPDSADFNLSNADFTIEFWVWFDSLTVTSGVNHVVFSQFNDDASNRSFFMGVNGNGSTAHPILQYNTTDNTTHTMALTGLTLSTGQWYHWAFLRNATDLRFYLDGDHDSGNGTQSISTDSIHNSSELLYISNYGGAGGPFHVNGWVDEVRISDNDRYGLSNFTSPSGAFTNDANTKLLLHLNGLNGATTSTDSSSGAHTLTFNDAAQLVTGRKKFGSSSLNLNVTPPDPFVNIRNDRFFLLYN